MLKKLLHITELGCVLQLQITYYNVITTNCGLNANIFLNNLDMYANFRQILTTNFDHSCRSMALYYWI